MFVKVAELSSLNISPSVKIISFDVFDTLLIRRIDPPDALKKIAANFVVQKLSLEISPVELLTLRLRIEASICKVARDEGRDEEFSVAQVYKQLCAAIPELAGIAEQLVAMEMEVERVYSAATPHIAEYLEEFSRNYRLIAISDTYLSGGQLKALLDMHNLGGYFSNVYASCDYGCNKGSGKLFNKVLEIEESTPSECLHLGDNFLSDYFMPRSLGINSVLILDNVNQQRKNYLHVLHSMALRSPGWKGFEVIGALTTTFLSPDPYNAVAKLHEWGVKTLGPPVVLFVHELCVRLKQSPNVGVYFLAREGYMLKRLYELFNRELFGGSLPQGRYLCISRSAAFLASLREIGEREIDLALQDYSVELRDVLRRFGIDDEEDVVWIAQEYGVTPSLNDKEKIRTLLGNLGKDSRFKSIVEARSEDMRRKLEPYLESVGLLSWNEVALVDVGWHGTIQDCLERYLWLRGSGPRIHGYYLGVDNNSSCSFLNKTGLLHDFRMPTVDSTCLTFFRLAFEFSLRAGHGTTIGYKDGSYWQPLFKQNQQELESFRHIKMIQNGVVDFANTYIDIARIEQLNPAELTPAFLYYYNKKISFPDSGTIAAFSTLIHTEDYATDKIRYIISGINLSELSAPKKIYSNFIEIPWRESALAKLRIPLLLSLYYFYKKWLAGRRINKYEKLHRWTCEVNNSVCYDYGFSSLAVYYTKLLIKYVISTATGILIRILRTLPAGAALIGVRRLILLKARFHNFNKLVINATLLRK